MHILATLLEQGGGRAVGKILDYGSGFCQEKLL